MPRSCKFYVNRLAVGRKERMISPGWTDAPVDVLSQITGLLDLRDLQAARSVCRQWHLGISVGVTELQPRMEANAVGLQWTELHKLQAAFPGIKELDLRQRPPNALHAPCFAHLTSLERIYISSVHRPSDPDQLIKEVYELAIALQEAHPALKIDLDLRFGCPLGTKSDRGGGRGRVSVQALTNFPSNLEVTSFAMPMLCSPIPTQDYRSLMCLSHLQHLKLVSYAASITDDDFAGLAGLPHLRMLSFGVLTNVTDKGLLKGLGKLTNLEELCLYDTKNVTDLGFGGMAERLELLKSLSLSKCHRMTNGGLASLAKLPMLNSLFLSENELITCEGTDRFHARVKSLVVRQCPHVKRSDILI